MKPIFTLIMICVYFSYQIRATIVIKYNIYSLYLSIIFLVSPLIFNNTFSENDAKIYLVKVSYYLILASYQIILALKVGVSLAFVLSHENRFSSIYKPVSALW